MSEPKWTPAQRAAIDDRGGALLVSAAAGSGKTAVLTERAVRLITDPDRPVDADKLLIVTFTNAAAAELKARIGQALLQRSQADPSSAFLRRQRMLLQRAPICTIDAFCLDLLRKNFQALEIPPDFSTADAGSVESLSALALAETLEQAYRDADFCAFADLYGKGRTDRAAGEAVLNVYRFLRSLPDYDRKLDEFLAPWQTENGFSSTCWHDLLLAEAARCAHAGRELFSAALADCQLDLADARAQATTESDITKANDQFAEPLERLESGAALLAETERLAAAGQWTPLYDRLTPYVLGREQMPGLKGMKKRLSGERRAAVRTRAGEASALFAQITELIACSEAEAEADRRAAYPRLRALFAAVRDYDARFTAKKSERKLLEFSDFEHLALKLLRGPDGEPTPLCESVRRRYAAVMVDEYQDTNALQDALYRCLAAPSGNNLFLVGDLKQSIYRFRQADPSIFREKLDVWPTLPSGAARPRPAAGQTGRNALLALDANFRSAPQVVAGINFLFEQLMTPALGGTAYGDGQRLVCGAPGPYAGGVEAEFLADDSAETDADWVAGRIEALLGAKEPVRDGGAERPVRPEDICILLSARRRFPVYTAALAARGIPFYADSREDLLDAPHIRPLISLLRVLDNPAQDIFLAAVMLGPLFGFSDDDLVRLRTLQKAAAPQRASLYGVLLAAADRDETNELTARVRAFCARLSQLRRLAHSVPMEELLEEIFVSTGYLAALGAMENGARRREDARQFAAYCAAAGVGGLSALVRAIDDSIAAGGPGLDGTPAASRPGCVTLMTIHRSKGLQFPVVFVADTGRRFNTEDIRRPVLLHREYGAGLRLRPEGGDGTYKTAAYTALACVQLQELRAEQMRLLYVAVTRAQDKLILTCPLGLSKSANPLEKAAAFLAADAGETLHLQASSFADWLREALLVHPDGAPLRRLAGNLELHFADTPSRITLGIQEPAAEQPEAAEAPAAPAAEADPALVEALRAGFAWQYPAARLSAVPAKVSVTSLVHRAEQTTLERPAFLSKDGLTAAEMGTALHAFLEHADFDRLSAARAQGPDAVRQAIRAERARQVEAKLTAPEIADKLEEEKIFRFVEGDAFARICSAQEVLRELDFITSLPAAAVLTAQGVGAEEARADAAAASARVLVQGIADVVLVFPDHLELLDYKTDRGKTEADFLRAYRAQLNLYALAIGQRYAPRRVTYKGLYSFSLGRLIEVTG